MAKPLRGECEVELNGRKYTLRLALGEIEELENLLNDGILSIAERFTSTRARLSDARQVLRLGFKAANIKIAPSTLQKMCEDAGLDAIKAATQLLLSVLSDNSGNADAADQPASPPSEG